jgi:hypothetical protein
VLKSLATDTACDTLESYHCDVKKKNKKKATKKTKKKKPKNKKKTKKTNITHITVSPPHHPTVKHRRCDRLANERECVRACSGAARTAGIDPDAADAGPVDPAAGLSRALERSAVPTRDSSGQPTRDSSGQRQGGRGFVATKSEGFPATTHPRRESPAGTPTRSDRSPQKWIRTARTLAMRATWRATGDVAWVTLGRLRLLARASV